MKKILCRRFTAVLRSILALAAVIGSVAASPIPAQAAAGETTSPTLTVILDPGHGGADGGAIGCNGEKEKNLNLSVALAIEKLLRERGINVIMTRSTDVHLCTEEQNAKGQRKVNDLRNRLLVAEQNPGAIFVSIHMNSYSASKYHGFQAYYTVNDNGESRQLAEAIQARVRADLQSDNNRQVKAAGENIYLLNHAVGTAVLLECGFLSNPEECSRLSEPEYREALSFSIVSAIMEYNNRTGV